MGGGGAVPAIISNIHRKLTLIGLDMVLKWKEIITLKS